MSRSWTSSKRKCVLWVDVYHDEVRLLRFRFRLRLRLPLRLHSAGSNRVHEKSELPSAREMIDRDWNRESLCHLRRRGADRSKRRRRKSRSNGENAQLISHLFVAQADISMR